MKRTQLKSDPDKTKAWKARAVATAQSKKKLDRENRHVQTQKKRACESKTSGAKREVDESGLIKRIDGLFSQICRESAGHVCYRCQGFATESHHIVGRGWANYWNTVNHMPLCERCHTWVTDHADGKRWNKAVAQLLGLNKHAVGERPSLDAMLALRKELTAELKRLKAAA